MFARKTLLIARLFRLPNLLVVALTQYLVKYVVLHPALLAAGIPPVVSHWKFLEITLVTVLITASGYVINDLQDGELDDINRPGTNPVRELGTAFVYWSYGAMVTVGFLISQLLAFRLEERHLLWIYPVAVAALAVYSVYLKRQPLLGNILVALYCAFVPGIVLLAERKAVRELLGMAPDAAYQSLRVCFLFMAFAFLATLLRELVKDIEDSRGDELVGRKTIPVLWGLGTARAIAIALALLLLLAILSPLLAGWAVLWQPALLVTITLMVIFIGLIAYQIWRAQESGHFKRISTELKLLLFAGLLLLILY